MTHANRVVAQRLRGLRISPEAMVRKALACEWMMDSEMRELVAREASHSSGLIARLDVIELRLGRRLPSKEVAARLGLHVATVDRYLSTAEADFALPHGWLAQACGFSTGKRRGRPSAQALIASLRVDHKAMARSALRGKWLASPERENLMMRGSKASDTLLTRLDFLEHHFFAGRKVKMAAELSGHDIAWGYVVIQRMKDELGVSAPQPRKR